MEYGTMRCYRCNALMSSGGYIHCSTCRTEDAIKKQTFDIQQSQRQNVMTQLETMLANQYRYARVVDKYEQEAQRNYSLNFLKSPPMTDEEKAIAIQESKKRLERYRKESQRDKILISALIISVLVFFGLVVYSAYKLLAFVFSL